MIKTNNLSKIFYSQDVETTALKNINLHIKKGEFVAIMGPSGCGKSTLLNIIGMLDQPTSGSLLFNNKEVADLKENQRDSMRRGNVNFVFQSFNLIDQLTVFKNVEMPLGYMNLKASEKKQRVQQVLDRMNMSHRSSHYPRQLSGGQQQRVAIARAVAANPKLLLADEPTGNLDSKNGLQVMRLLSQLNSEGTTIVMVTHSKRDAEFAHRIINLFDGSVVNQEQQVPVAMANY